MAKQFLSTPENWVKHFFCVIFSAQWPENTSSQSLTLSNFVPLENDRFLGTLFASRNNCRVLESRRDIFIWNTVFWVDIFPAILLYHSAWNLRTSAFLGQTDVRLRGNDFYLWLTSDHRYSVHYFPHLKYWFALKCSFKMCLMIFIAHGSVRYRVQ